MVRSAVRPSVMSPSFTAVLVRLHEQEMAAAAAAPAAYRRPLGVSGAAARQATYAAAACRRRPWRTGAVAGSALLRHA
jgi:hypothetical protein